MLDFLPDKMRTIVMLPSQSIASTNVTSRYVKAAKHNTFVMETAAIADSETAKLDVLGASDTAGTGAGLITGLGTVQSTKTITGRLAAGALTIFVGTAALLPTVGKTVIINGVTYTMAGALSAADGEFVTAAHLVTCINTLQGDTLIAVAAGTTVSVYLLDPRKGGTLTETGTLEATKLVQGTLFATTIITVACDSLNMVDDDDIYLAAKATTVGTILLSVMLYQENQSNPNYGHATVVRVY